MWILGYLEDVKSDFSAFHRVDCIEDAPHCFVIPRAERLVAYKGALRFTAEKESEERKTVQGVDGKSRQVDEVYSDPSENTEANALGLFERGTG